MLGAVVLLDHKKCKSHGSEMPEIWDQTRLDAEERRSHQTVSMATAGYHQYCPAQRTRPIIHPSIHLSLHPDREQITSLLQHLHSPCRHQQLTSPPLPVSLLLPHHSPLPPPHPSVAFFFLIILTLSLLFLHPSHFIPPHHCHSIPPHPSSSLTILVLSLLIPHHCVSVSPHPKCALIFLIISFNLSSVTIITLLTVSPATRVFLSSSSSSSSYHSLCPSSSLTLTLNFPKYISSSLITPHFIPPHSYHSHPISPQAS